MVQSYGLSWSTIVLAGISRERGPEAYAFYNDAEPPAHIQPDNEPFKLFKLPNVVSMNPAAYDPASYEVAPVYEEYEDEDGVLFVRA